MEALMVLMRHAPERGRHIDVGRWAEPLLRRLADAPPSLRTLEFHNAYAYFLVQTLQFKEGLQIAQKTVAMAETLGNEHEVARAHVRLGHLLLWQGQTAEARNLLEPVVSSLERVGDLPETMRATSLLAQVFWFSGDLRSAESRRERALQLARQVGDAAQGVYETSMLGYQHLRLGALDDAWEAGRRALADARALDRSTMSGTPLGLLATVSWTQGKWDELERYTGEMIALSEHSDEPWWRRHGNYIRALRDLLDERADRAVARMEPLVTGVELDMQEQTLYLPALAQAYLQVGNLDRARTVLAAPLALRDLEVGGMLPDTLRVHAMLLRAGGDLPGAETVLNHLLDLTRGIPWPFAEAQALAEWGQLEAARGNSKQARQRFEEALTVFRRVDAQPFIERTERALAEIGADRVLDV
jgi:tetratricopeptide (TPR) repeat protein